MLCFITLPYVPLHSTVCVDVKVQTGDEVACVILDIDLVDCCLMVSLNPKLTSNCELGESSGRVLRSSSKKKKEAKPSVPAGPSGSLKATVEHKTPYYFMLSYTTVTGTGLAYGVMDTVSYSCPCCKLNTDTV